MAKSYRTKHEPNYIPGRCGADRDEMPAAVETSRAAETFISSMRAGGIQFQIVREGGQNVVKMLRSNGLWAEVTAPELTLIYGERCGPEFCRWVNENTDLFQRDIPLHFSKYRAKLLKKL